MEPVRRATDDELCGHVQRRHDRWRALTVFGGELGQHETRDAAVDQVLADGLASMAERWTLRSNLGVEEVVCIQEANPETVTVARGYYSMPGVPTLTITSAQFAAGEWSLHR